ncbi:MAG: SDR family NAD(P)-dependent oxidoreductase, partial [Clostridiales bacterium]|nr:SDR family NAD(P)-dependent oxidoreductase [Clostridiales bacterium]
MRLEGKVAVITGASSGIGAETARVFANEGAYVVLAARRLDRLEALASEIISKNGKAIAVQADVTKPEDCKKISEAAIAEFGQID